MSSRSLATWYFALAWALAIVPAPVFGAADDPSPLAQLREAEGFADTGRLAASGEKLRKLLDQKLEPEVARQAVVMLMSVYNDSGRFGDTLKLGEKYAALANQAIDAKSPVDQDRARRWWLGLAEANTALEQYDEAANQLKRVAESPSNDPQTELKLAVLTARLSTKREDATHADRDWSRVADLASKDLQDKQISGQKRRFATRALASANAHRQKIPQAVEVLNRLLADDQNGGRLEDQIATLTELAELRAKQNDRARQIELLLQALRLQKQIKPADEAAEADLEMELAAAENARGGFSAARRHWHAAANLYERLIKIPTKREQDVQIRIVMLGRLQTARQRLNDFAGAIAPTRRLLAYRLQRLDPADPRIFESKTSLGVYVGTVGEADESRRLLEEAVPYWRQRKPAAHRELIGAMGNLAIAKRDLGQFAEAQALLDQTLDLAKQHLAADDVLTAETMVNRATVLAALGHFSKALDDYRAAAKMFESMGPIGAERLANTLLNIAVAHTSQGQNAEALKLANQALDLRLKVCDHNDPVLLDHFMALATIHANAAQWEETLAALDRAEKICERNATIPPRQIAQIQYLQGLVAYRQQPPDYSAAAKHWQASLEPLKKSRDRTLRARVLNYLGELAMHDEHWDDAAKLLDQSAKLQDEIGAFPTFHYVTLCNCAQVLRKLKKPDEAIERLRGAIELAELPRASTSGGDQERARYFAQFSTAYDLLVDWYVEAGEIDKAFAVAERGRNRTFLDQVRAGGVDLAQTLVGTPAEPLIAKNRELADRVAGLQSISLALEATGSNTTRMARLEQDLCDLRSQQASLWRQIRDASPFYRDLLARDPAAELSTLVLKQVEQEQEFILSYYLGLQHGYLFVLGTRAGDLECHRLKIEPELAQALGVENDELNRSLATAVVKRWLATVSRPAQETQSRDLGAKVLSRKAIFTGPQARAFAQIVLPMHVRARIEDSDASVITIVPDGALAELPFEALPADREQFFVDVLPPLDYSPSAMILASLETRQHAREIKTPQVVTLGDPQYSDTMSTADSGVRQVGYSQWQSQLTPLPHTLEECERIARTFGDQATKLSGRQATESNLRAAINRERDSREPYFLHLAAHGIVDEQHDNLFGAIALSPDPQARSADHDGWLMLHEIYSLSLAGCDLAVLSACRTSIGPEQPMEASSSLARAFLAAGAQRVVASHWSVDDAATAELMGSFFENLARTTSGPAATVRYAEALRQARLQVAHNADHPEWANPYYWAAFTLVGPPNSYPVDQPPRHEKEHHRVVTLPVTR